MKYKRIAAVVAAVYFVAGLFTIEAADAPSLGSNWPNSADVSHSAYHHVYRWQRQGVTYIQVNSASGQPELAFAYTATGSLLLPVGDPDKVHIDLSSTTAPLGGQSIFDDGMVSVVQGATGFNVIASPTNSSQLRAMDESTCNGDPIECSRVN